MRRLRERIEGLIEGPTAELLLRLRVVLVARQVDLVAASAEQRRGELLRDCAQQVDCEVDRCGRRDAQLACGRLVRVRRPWRRLGACDVLRVCLGDGRGMPGCVDFLRDYLFSALDLVGLKDYVRRERRFRAVGGDKISFYRICA
jgi:hypothetical protein